MYVWLIHRRYPSRLVDEFVDCEIFDTRDNAARRCFDLAEQETGTVYLWDTDFPETYTQKFQAISPYKEGVIYYAQRFEVKNGLPPKADSEG